MVVMYNQRAQQNVLVAMANDAISELANDTEVALPDYNFQDPEAPPQDFERPVEVTTPEPPPPPTPVAREPSQVRDPVMSEDQPTPLPGATPDVEKPAVERVEMEQAAPRKGPQPGLLSRHMTNVDVHPGAAAGVPDSETPPQPQVEEMGAAATPIARQASEVAARAASETPSPLPARPSRQCSWPAATRSSRTRRSLPRFRRCREG